MVIARTLIRRLLVAVVLVFSFLKLAVARIVPSDSESLVSPTETSHITTGRIVRFVPFAEHKDPSVRYVLEASAVFPYIRILELRQLSPPMPVEVAPVPVATTQKSERRSHVAPAKQKRHSTTRRRPLTRRMQSDHEKKPFCYPANSQSCLNCPTCCIICGCGGCSGCSGCSGCGSCTC
jgi:hypothetical protein